MIAANAHVKPLQRDAESRLIAENFGLFVHLVPGLTTNSNGEICNLEAISKFDVAAFASDLAKFKVQYLRFTAWHKDMIPLYPSGVMQKWRGSHAYLKRDVIGELIAELRPLGIKLQLYTHPRDGHDFSIEDRLKTGWGNGSTDGSADPDGRSFDFKRWNAFIFEAYQELLVRYGSDISGIYLDEGSERGDSEWVVDYRGLRDLIKLRCPNAVMIQNYYGNLYSCDIADHEYGRWGDFSDLSGANWPTFKNQSISTVVGSTFWAAVEDTAYDPGFEVVDLYRYLVMQIATSNSGGGVAFAAGPYSAQGWEPGVEKLLVDLGQLFDQNRESLEAVTASKRWPSPGGLTFSSVGWGVAVDHRTESYLHILRPPAEGFIKLPRAADGSSVNEVRRIAGGASIPFDVSTEGEITIDCRDVSRDSEDTVFVVSTTNEACD